MSVFVMSLVWKRFPSGGGDMLLALALADHASDDGTKVYPSIKHLAAKTRQSERTVQYQLRRMEEMGWIILVNAGNGGRNMSREYNINPAWINGAELAPLQKTPPETPGNAGGANSAPPENGANGGVKGASDDGKGATDGRKGATAIAPANNHHQPSSITSKPTTPPAPPAPPAPAAPKKAKAGPASPVVVLPDWLPVDVWEMWVRHRAKDKKTLLDEDSAALQIKKLAKLLSEGNDPVLVIETSIERGWVGLFEVKTPQAPVALNARKQPYNAMNPGAFNDLDAAFGSPAANHGHVIDVDARRVDPQA